MGKKLKLLAWGDICAATGFSNVMEHILRPLYDTGKYDIDVLGINYQGQFVDKEKYPYQLSPARLLDPQDPHGLKSFVRTIGSQHYDIVFILNDFFVVQPIAKAIREVRERRISESKVPPMFVYYYPVDLKVVPGFSDVITAVDVAVAYTEYGKKETLKVHKELEGKLPVIYHGVDTESFYPLPRSERRKFRKAYLGADDDTFVIVNINRNSIRKQLATSILALKEIRKTIPNSVLYLHTLPQDNMSGIDLFSAVRDLGLSYKRDVLFPAKLNMSKGYPVEVLNQYYNCADCCLTNTLGEGYGLFGIESLAAGRPLVAPANTVHPELFGENGERAILYPCEDLMWADNLGYRPVGRLEDIVAAIKHVHEESKEEKESRAERGLEWCKKNTWETIGQQWVDLFDQKWEKFFANKGPESGTLHGSDL